MAQQRQITTHGINLNSIAVKQYHFECDRNPESITIDDFEKPQLHFANQGYNAQDKIITTYAAFDAVTKDKGVKLIVELVCEFDIDTEAFPESKIDEWAEKGAMLIIAPFLREHVYSLSARVGLPKLIIPTFHVPTYLISVADEPPVPEPRARGS